ncbi:MAG: ATP-binding protein, partial [Coprobacillaceae bacterium]
MTKVKFRPSARLIITIGEDIIKDMHAALVELVKNAYDADAKNVEIVFSKNDDFDIIIEVIDDGHGMSEDVVKNKWFVPSTSDKLTRNRSPKGRIMQGRKGIGRFAAAILAERIILKSVNNNVETVAKINWNDFADSKYLDEIEIDVRTKATTANNGTIFQMFGSKEKRSIWNKDQFDFLIKDLKTLLTPSNKLTPISEIDNKDQFNIKLKFDNFDLIDGLDSEVEIEPFPLLDYYDYRVYGNVYANKKMKLQYHNKNNGTIETITEHDIQLSFKEKEFFDSDLYIDFRIFDRDPEAIETLSQQLSSTLYDSDFGINETKRMLNDISGVSIFRNGFRIRPYGDEEYDWLSLDKSRVQNPAQKIGANQISGYVVIASEEYSKLKEKSARDGLKEDSYYFGLVSIIKQILIYTENKR